ncbi:hypothetical protein KKH13_04560 [Patescibacteria group bacterium]|uniref:Uncharacterized protein n=1 Tax=viral metagenome TaxID=1070528 RepID=A0A6M3IRZ0_9ZZZZ|nr:hypothetical protein [Patescibacteria group bacterium]
MKDVKLVNGKFEDKSNKKYDITEVSISKDYTYKKPFIDEVKELTSDEQGVVEFSLKGCGRRLVHCELRHKKNDYKHDYDRGTVEHTIKCRNYSFHKVVIPDGSVIREKNFTQVNPDTDAISGKNITFIECNLVNVKIDPTWIIQSCNTCQVKTVVKERVDEDGNTTLKISHQVKRDGVFVEEAEYFDTFETGELTHKIKRYSEVL